MVLNWRAQSKHIKAVTSENSNSVSTDAGGGVGGALSGTVLVETVGACIWIGVIRTNVPCLST